MGDCRAEMGEASVQSGESRAGMTESSGKNAGCRGNLSKRLGGKR
jgi:hypothetical protein